MRLIIFPVIFLLTFLLVGCDKPKGDDLSGDYKIKGTLVLKDTLRGTGEEVILNDYVVQVKTDTSSTNFLFQVKTNSVGGFEVPNLSNKAYFLYAEKKIADVLYATNLQIDPATKDTYKMTLYPVARDYNILSVVAKDSSAAVIEVLNNVSVCLFKSKQQSDDGRCENAVWSDKTDKFGRAQTTRLAAGTYYINTSLTLNNITLVAKDTVLIGATGIRQKQIFLKSGSIYSISGEVFLNDTLSGISEEVALAGQVVQVKRLEDANNQSFLQQVTSSERGLFSFSGLPEGTYWLQAEKTIKGVLYKSTAVVKTGSPARMVLLPNATNYNILQIVAMDASGGLLKNTRVCIFNSSQLALNSMCDGALYSDLTDINGRLSFLRLPAGKYFINTEFTAGNTVLHAKDDIGINATGIFQKQIVLKP